HTILSEGSESRSTTVPLAKGDRVRVDDEVFGDGHRLLVRAIEVDQGRRVNAAPAEDIKTLWCMVFDKLTIKIAVNKGHITHSDEMDVVPEEEFFVGDEITVHNQPVRIKAIKTHEGIRRHGSAQARDIVRMFAERTDWKAEQQAKEREQARKDRSKRSYRGGGDQR
ncbi:MAG: HVO_0476 family zinc finger protein, partial [Candidatus Thermoplasmatota archaeon]|nr:HVO_0476 family zinc finger protein [Candidatus Thermoplasmatota archaeon]